MKIFIKRFVLAVEVIGGLFFALVIAATLSDKYLKTDFQHQLASNTYVAIILDLVEEDVPYVVVDQSDPYFLALDKKLSQIVKKSTIKSIKVQELPDQKNFLIMTKDDKELRMMVELHNGKFMVKVKK